MKRFGVLTVAVGVMMVSPVLAGTAHADSPQDKVVGAVTLTAENSGLTVTIEIQAFSNPDGSDPSGHFRAETTGASAGNGGLSGHVTCLSVSGNRATVGFVVDRASGAAAGLVGKPDVDFVLDNGVPGNGQPDFEDLNPHTGYTGDSTCPAWQDPKLPALRGNVTVSDA